MHWINHFLGLDSPTSAPYLFWSGIANSIIWLGALYGLYKHHKCILCFRLALRDHGQFCLKHHKGVSVEDV